MSGGDRAAAMEAQGSTIIRRVPDRLMPGNVSSQLQPDKSGQLLHKVFPAICPANWGKDH